MEPITPLAIIGAVGGISVACAGQAYRNGWFDKILPACINPPKKAYKQWKVVVKEMFQKVYDQKMVGAVYSYYKEDIKQLAKMLSSQILDISPVIIDEIANLILRENVIDIQNKELHIQYIKDGQILRRQAVEHKKDLLLNKVLSAINSYSNNTRSLKYREQKKVGAKLEVLQHVKDCVEDIIYKHREDDIDDQLIIQLETKLFKEKSNLKYSSTPSPIQEEEDIEDITEEDLVEQETCTKPSAPVLQPASRNSYPILNSRTTRKLNKYKAKNQQEQKPQPQPSNEPQRREYR